LIKQAVLLAALLGTAGTASAQQTNTGPYIDPRLRMLAQPDVRRAVESRAPVVGGDQQARPWAGLAIRQGAAGVVPTVSFFAQLSSPAGADELRALGANIGSLRNGIATVELPLGALDRLESLQNVRSIEASNSLTIRHDSASRAIRANDVRKVVGGVWTGTTGQGVIVGVFDTGIDFTHEDFRDANGATRLLGLWDMTRSGQPPAGFNLGFYCDRAAIQRVIDNPAEASTICPEQDTNGHGSHTSGTAAGDGSAVGNGGTAFQYAGVAPMADLIMVKGGNTSFTETNVVDGLRWMEAESRARNQPIVVNLSLGGQAGPHDGTRLFEQEIDNLSRPGFIVVTSSGNEGSNNNVRRADGTPFPFNPLLIHGTGTAITGTTREFVIEVPTYTPATGRCNEGFGFSLWYQAEDRLRITLVRPDGSSHFIETGASQNQDNALGNISINMAAGVNPQNGDREAVIFADDCGTSGGPPSAGTWTMRVAVLGTGSGQPYHFWFNLNQLGIGVLARGRAGFDNRYIVGSPGNAHQAVTVGAFVTRLCWPTPTAQRCFTEVEEIGDLARFSSGGPTRDGRMKPDIVAPGMAVVSVNSRNAPQGTTVVTDGVHRANQGTSMAAPHVTGAIALMMQLRPTLTAAEVKQIFSRAAVRDGFTTRTYGTEPGSSPSDWWGYGKLQLPRLLCEVGGASSLNIVTITPESDTLPQNATLRLEACAIGAGAGVVTFASSNPNVASVDATGTVRGLQTGNALIIARAGTLADTTTITVVPPATVITNGDSVGPRTSTLGKRGTLLPLLSLSLRTQGFENVNIGALAFRLSGADPGARVLVAQDLNRNNQFDASDRLLGTASRGSNLNADTIRINTPGLSVAQRDSLRLIVAIELSGAARNQTPFQLQFLPSASQTAGARSGAADRLVAGSALIAASAITTVLTASEQFALSENPVRSNRVVFNFQSRPNTAAIYTVTGRRVRDLKAMIDQDGAVEWNLTNEDGNRVAPGIYLVIFDVGGVVVREKLFVLTPNQ
jgi:subtilisin family serine protease